MKFLQNIPVVLLAMLSTLSFANEVIDDPEGTVCRVEFKKDDYPKERLSQCVKGNILFIRGTARSRGRTLGDIVARNCEIGTIDYLPVSIPSLATCVYRGSEREIFQDLNSFGRSN